MSNDVIISQTCPTSGTLSFSNFPNNEYTFEFLGITPLGGGNYRWCYNVSVNLENRGLSHFVLEFCPEITAENVLEVTVNGNPAVFEFGTFNYDATETESGQAVSLYGLKVEETLDANESVEVCFVLNVNAPPEAQDLLIKTGGEQPTALLANDFICGPGCPVPPTPGQTRGIIL